MKVLLVITLNTNYATICTIRQLFLLSRFWISYISRFHSYKKAIPWDKMLQFCSCKYLLIPQSQKRLSKKSCGCYNMVHQWPIEVESIISPMGSAFRASSGHSTTWSPSLPKCSSAWLKRAPPLPCSRYKKFGSILVGILSWGNLIDPNSYRCIFFS